MLPKSLKQQYVPSGYFRAFTMVELMAVLVNIALLTALSAFAYRSVQVNASETAGVSMVEQVRKMSVTNAALY